MTLARYHQKRDFGITPEPRGHLGRRKSGDLAFVIQKHAASHLHYDFRLELDGVLLSWAVPKGPSVDPADRRLAMHVEDHPLEYGGFEGTIPAKQYGGGTVMVWDRGRWIPQGDAREGYAKGHLKFELDGEKLKGGYALIRSQPGRFGGKYGGKRAGDVWFLIKERDTFARPGVSIVEAAPDSVQTGRSLDEIAAGRSRVWNSNRSVADNVRAGALGARGRKPAATPDRRAGSTAKRSAGDAALPAAARRARLPSALSPMLATLVKSVPPGDGWLHEVKYDGYRMLARVERGRARLYSRNGNDWTTRLAPIARAVAALPLASGWIDGEIAVADASGRTSFQRLQNALASPADADITFFVFDLPFANGYDLRQVPLVERKAMLRALLDPPPSHVRYGVEIVAEGSTVFTQACTLGLEGIISKRMDSRYQGARGRDWVKVKCGHRQEMVIAGYTDPAGSREGLGALVVAIHDDAHALRYSGRVGTGFDAATLRMLASRLAPLAQASPPVINPPRGAAARGVHWVKPTLVAEIAFTEWTHDGTLRHPSFLGLREDKKAADVVRERAVPTQAATGSSKPTPARAAKRTAAAKVASGKKPSAKRSPAARSKARVAPSTSARKKPLATSAPKVRDRKRLAARAVTKSVRRAGTAASNPKPAAERRANPTAVAAKSVGANAGDAVVEGVAISHPDKLYFADAGVTKLEVARYFASVAPHMLPHVTGRPLALLRCPEGWQGECFFQKHAPPSLNAAVGRVEVPESAGTGTYAEVHSAKGLAALVQWGVLEIHLWGSRMPRIDRPDRLIFDFDPDDAVEWDALVEGVKAMRTFLAELGLPAFVKTTGGKGLHVVTPIRASVDWDAAKSFTRAIAELMARTFPERFVATMTKSRRQGKIFIDYLRNAEGATAVAPYGLRARAGAPVAMPIEWRELDQGIDLRRDHFNVRNAGERLATRKSDPWRDFAASAPSLTAAMRRRVGAG
ncbi:MAG TPA: non-homologous end-joining DNA ligase [Casimicrobiaceae bacterium]|jgi:bifunctional non-homologous end joining protein LigD|nr:non-homologous end-joining DNA ligase [Casimicrobiaceae bacterium]